MKGKKFYVLLVGLILVGLGSIFLYRQQEEQRVLEFEGYEISAIEDRVEALYNAEKTDIANEISEEELEELETIFEELDEKRLSRRNRDQIRDMELDFLIAREMMKTEKEVEEVFVEENVVDKEVSEENINDLEYDVLTFENMPDYVDRNIELLAYARQQVLTIERATEFVESLFDEEENVLETVTRAEEEEAIELIEEIQNQEIKEELTARIETVSLVLTEREEQLALEEEMQAAEEEELVEDTEGEIEEPAVYDDAEEVDETEEAVEVPQYTAPPAQPWTPTPPVNSGTGGSTGSGGSGNGSSSTDNDDDSSDGNSRNEDTGDEDETSETDTSDDLDDTATDGSSDTEDSEEEEESSETGNDDNNQDSEQEPSEDEE